MILATHGIVKNNSSAGYGALTTAWITATSETDTTIISALNTLETDLTTYGLTAKIKALYPMVGGTASKHKFNFMDARDLDVAFRLTFNGGWTHSSTGALPNGTNAFADTYLQPSVSLSQNDTHLAYYSRTNRTKDFGVPIGGYDNFTNGQLMIFARTTSNTMLNRINVVSFTLDTYAGITDSKGFYIGNRTISSYSKLFRNGTSLGNGALVSSALTTKTLTIGASNGAFGTEHYDNEELAIASIGNGLTDGEAVNLYTAVQAFQTTLARQIVSYGALTTAWISARSITDVPTINAVNTFETAISSIVTKFHHIHFLFNGDATKNNYNFIGNSTFDLTYFGSITHASTGIKSTTNGYFKTGYIPSTHSTLDSSHISAYNRTNNTVPNSETKLLMGCFQTTGLEHSTNLGPIWSGSPSWVFNTNGVWQDNTLFTTLPLPWVNTNRFLIGSRTSSTDIIGGIDKTYLSRTTAVGRNNSSNREVFGLCSNYVGTPSFYSDKEISFISQGTGLTTSEMLLLNNAVDTLMTTLGINV